VARSGWISSLSVGEHRIVALYSGDTVYAASSTEFVQLITAAP